MENPEINLSPLDPLAVAAPKAIKVYHAVYGEESEVPADADFVALSFLGWEKVKGKGK
jgi:hypothetical protein